MSANRFWVRIRYDLDKNKRNAVAQRKRRGVSRKGLGLPQNVDHRYVRDPKLVAGLAPE